MPMAGPRNNIPASKASSLIKLIEVMINSMTIVKTQQIRPLSKANP